MPTFFGTAGNDFLSGTTGIDSFIGSAGNDTLNGSAGIDTANYLHLNNFGFAPSITLLPTTGFVRKGVSGAFGTDRLNSIERIIANANAIINNLIDASSAGAGVSIIVNLSLPNFNLLVNGGNGSLTVFEVRNFDDVIGTSGNDVINGDAQNNILNGDAGNDTINGGSDNDTLIGGAGNDTLIGGVGADRLTGGSGVNTFVYNSRDEGAIVGDIITDFKGSDRIQLRSSSFAGFNFGTLSSNRYGEGFSLSSAAFAAQSAGAFGAAVLGVSSGSNVQVWYTGNTFSTASSNSGATLLATLSGVSLATISQSNFSVIF